jgi:hypothetical protein
MGEEIVYGLVIGRQIYAAENACFDPLVISYLRSSTDIGTPMVVMQ